MDGSLGRQEDSYDPAIEEDMNGEGRTPDEIMPFVEFVIGEDPLEEDESRADCDPYLVEGYEDRRYFAAD